jgi:hypothetical protein
MIRNVTVVHRKRLHVSRWLLTAYNCCVDAVQRVIPVGPGIQTFVITRSLFSEFANDLMTKAPAKRVFDLHPINPFEKQEPTRYRPNNQLSRRVRSKPNILRPITKTGIFNVIVSSITWRNHVA